MALWRREEQRWIIVGEYSPIGFGAPLTQSEGEFSRDPDGPSDQMGFSPFPFPFPAGCSRQAKANFPQDFRAPWTTGDLLTVLRAYLSADSVEIRRRNSQGTGPRFEESVRPRSSLFMVIPALQI